MTERYMKAAHAMQSGVAMEMNHNTRPTEPKHLRVGVNAAMSDQAGLVQLLIDKGVFTSEEYMEAVTKSMEAEVARYEALLSEVIGAKVTLA